MSLNLTDAQEEFLISIVPPKYTDDDTEGAKLPGSSSLDDTDDIIYSEYELQRVSDAFMDEYNIYISTDDIYDFYCDFEQSIRD